VGEQVDNVTGAVTFSVPPMPRRDTGDLARDGPGQAARCSLPVHQQYRCKAASFLHLERLDDGICCGFD
jgi:hypothetical protein